MSEGARSQEDDEGQDLSRLDIRRVAQILANRATLTNKVEHPELLRGCSAGAILSGFGINFKARNLAGQSFSQEEAANLWGKSRQIKQLDYFVSHSWRSSRFAKVLALLINTNMVPASVISVLVAVACLIGQEGGLLPLVEATNLSGEFKFQYFPWCYFAGCISFFLAFAYSHHVIALFGLRKAYFFDKFCVHQLDEDFKIAAILSFGGYVGNCKQLVLLWDKIHFSRLWCVFEMAALVKAHEHDESLPLIFLPLSLASLSFWGWIFIWFAQGVYSVNRCMGYIIPATPLVGITCLFCLLGLAVAIRRYMKDRAALSNYLSNFKVSETECFLERDREYVNRTLVSWFGSLDNFDMHVRTKVRQKVLSTIGSDLHFPLKYTWPLFLIRALQEMDSFGGDGYWRKLDWAELAREAPGAVAWAALLLTCFPVSLRFASLLPNVQRRWLDNLAILALTLLTTVYGAGFWYVTNSMMYDWPLFVSWPLVLISWLWLLWLQRRSFACLQASTQSSEVPTFESVDQPDTANAQEPTESDKPAAGSISNEDCGENDEKLFTVLLNGEDDGDKLMSENF